MARKIAVVSGKGGVGKSTISANLSFALAKKCKRVLLVDMDFGLNSLDILLRCKDNILFDLNDCVEGKCRFKQALINDKKIPSMYILLSGAFRPNQENAKKFAEVIKKEESNFDFIFFDCGAGINNGLNCAFSVADESMLVVTPHLVSVKNAKKLLEYCKTKDFLQYSVIVNRIRGDLVKSGEQLSAFEVFSLISEAKKMGVVPENDFLNGFCLSDSPYFDCIANNLLNGKQKLYDYMAEYRGLLGKIKSTIKRNI